MSHIQQSFSVKFEYNVFFTEHLFNSTNPLFAQFLTDHAGQETRKKLLFVLDEGVKNAHPELDKQIGEYCEQLPGFELMEEILVLPGGEAVKNDLQLFYWLVNAIEEHGIDRHSYVIAIGGGSVLDLVGYVAAVSHRGVKHIRIPTTVLSQNDSGVGVKNGINYHGKKNFLGTFAPPVAVFNDATFLSTLEERDWRSGMSEAVKVALIKDAAFFEWMEAHAAELTVAEPKAMHHMIFRCAELHVAHISSGDAFESGSSRPLDFGHWSAHKLEQLTEFEIRHGEAVAIGIALDSVYSYLVGWLQKEEMQRIIDLLKTLRLPLYHPLLETTVDEDDEEAEPNMNILAGLNEFREHLGGQLTITLLRKIGQGEEVHEMDEELLQEAVNMLRDQL
ncbi:3-dehydroquinate synthase [Chitinophaga skermanii]|uniref:3-dehydroquinate synthase n=1 Tax=Chitinophaga skermanii TaxID=331697 RepID=A0A327R491_9BACT|nr:3-dehydroquinate synthase [Chitinophaga skermanii]RAJ10762.1 3-dehydroquinate synthase [Chitinophaga skermanii]